MRAVEVTGEGGAVLRGEEHSGSGIAALFVHECGTDLDAWGFLPRRLAGLGWTVVAIDVRGHGGSEGEWSPELAWSDLSTLLTRARRLSAPSREPLRIIVIAAGESAVAALRAAGHERDVASLVLLSPGAFRSEDGDDLRAPGVAKIFVYGSDDPAVGAYQALSRLSIGWTVTVTFPTAARGTALVGTWSDHIYDQILGVAGAAS